jgi:asparagine synthase (glutamine-hydrolysing)
MYDKYLQRNFELRIFNNMCGIFGAVRLKGFFEHQDFSKFTNHTNLVAHRGPDAVGVLGINTSLGNINNEQFDIFLGHRRLSIIDLSADGNQPMRFNNLIITYNGEIFNYIELKEELQSIGAVFSTKSDTEVILQLYQYYGEKSFEKLNGMWAFVLVDLDKKRVIVSRDRFSIKPLFFHKTATEYFFASEIKQLLPLLKSVEPNKNALFNFIQQNLVDIKNESFFKDIFRIPAKNNFIIDLNSGNNYLEKYWDYTSEEKLNENENYEKFSELFYDSVKIRLRSDVEVGALLSGGLDSSSITVAAQKYCANSIKAFSVISGDKKISEEKFIDILINEKQISCFKLEVTPEEIFNNLDKTIDAQGEPFPSFSIVAQYSILEKIKKESDIRVVLSGQGGDEILMGYLKYYFFYLQHLLKTNNFHIFTAELFSSLINRTAITQLRMDIAKRYIPFMNSSKVDYLIYDDQIEEIWKINSLIDRQKKDVDIYSVPMLARFEDRNSMAHSIETRLPMMDHRLVNFVLNVEPKYKIKNGWTKYLLRKSIKELPEKIKWRRDKLGFVIPERSWLKTTYRSKIKKMFQSSTLGEIGLIDDKKFLKYYDSYLDNSFKIHSSDISKILIAEKWAGKYFSGDSN